MTKDRLVVIHPVHGLFLGRAENGLFCFSNRNTLTPVAYAWECLDQIYAFLDQWRDIDFGMNTDFEVVPVRCKSNHATIDELLGAGLGNFLGAMAMIEKRGHTLH